MNGCPTATGAGSTARRTDQPGPGTRGTDGCPTGTDPAGTDRNGVGA